MEVVMGKRTKKKRRLRKLLKACDPEISVLSLLIVQAQVIKERKNFSGMLERRYAENPDELIRMADLKPEMETAWKAGKWKTLRKLFKGSSEAIKPNMPTGRGWPP
jgi:hypothetical protein